MTWWSWPCHQIDWVWPYFDWCNITCFLDLLNVYHPSFFSLIRLFLLVYGHVLHSPFCSWFVRWIDCSHEHSQTFPFKFVNRMSTGCQPDVNLISIKKRKKVAKKRKECLQDLDGFVAKNFVVCHQKSPKVTGFMGILYINYKNYP